jgi:tetratricopeptide (TPR) repeat protein
MATIGPSSQRLEQAVAAHQAGRLGEAETIYRELLAAAPLNVGAAYNLAVLLVNGGRAPEAAAWAERALAVQPRAARLHNVRGMALAVQGRWPAAIAAYEDAIRNEPRLAEAQSNLSLALRETGQIRRAIEAAEAAVVLSPASPEALNNLGNALDEAGERARAEQAYASAVAAGSEFAIGWHNYANVHRFTVGDPMLARLDAVVSQTDEAKSWLWFARAKARDDIGDFATAATLLSEVNALMRTRDRFDLAAHGKMLNAMQAGFAAAPIDETTVGHDGHLPILILGASRAGKSLVERLLADGKEVVPFGEHLTWQGALAAAGVTDVALRPLSPSIGAAVAKAYRRLEVKVSLSTSPGNLLFAGMFLDAFPQGRVIWMRRDTRDHALRIYFKRYNAGNAFAYALGDIMQFLAQFDGLMSFWKARYGDRVVEVRYEELVTDAKAALAPIGLPVRDMDLSAAEIGRWRDYAPFWPELAGLGTARNVT